jgi:hypothetical protein
MRPTGRLLDSSDPTVMSAFIARLQVIQLSQESSCLFAPRLPAPLPPHPAIARLLDRKSSVSKSPNPRSLSGQRTCLARAVLLVEGNQSRAHSLPKHRKLPILPRKATRTLPFRKRLPDLSPDFNLEGW